MKPKTFGASTKITKQLSVRRTWWKFKCVNLFLKISCNTTKNTLIRFPKTLKMNYFNANKHQFCRIRIKHSVYLFLSIQRNRRSQKFPFIVSRFRSLSEYKNIETNSCKYKFSAATQLFFNKKHFFRWITDNSHILFDI